MANYSDLAQSVISGQNDQVKDHVRNFIAAGNSPLEIINEGLIAGMNVVGVRFKAGDMYVPEVLKAAKSMSAGLEIVKPLIAESDQKAKGKILLGTVKGDLHDIGKNLVGMLIESGGLEEKIITLPQGSVITPSARDFIRSKGIEVQIEGNGILDININTFSNAQQTVIRQKPFDERLNAPCDVQSAFVVKPEHMTHLHKGALVSKIHPMIAFRGQLDLFQCELVEAQVFFEQEGEGELILKLEEIAAFARQLMVSEVKEEPFQWTTLIGLTPDELRERSHYPKKYFGVEHTPLSYTYGKVVSKLQQLRAKSREVELYANRAFTDEAGKCKRMDLIQAFNRLSSAFYILACEVRGRGQQEKRVPIGVSNRHIHLSKEDINVLFGEAYALTIQKELSQPGQFAAKETITLVGPKGRLEKVRILGPLRKKTQVEISVTDSHKLGIKPVVRDSGHYEGTPGLQIVGPMGNVELESGVMVASRHIHLHTEEAKQWCLKDGDRVRVQVQSKRPMVFEDVLIRVSEDYRMDMHLDLDEANAALVDPQSFGVLIGV